MRDLDVGFRGVQVLHGVGFQVAPGETLALVGESGSGKSVTALAVMRLLPAPPQCQVRGEVLLAGRSLLGLPEAEMRAVRGGDIAMIFQEPMTSLNPVHRVGDQIAEAVLHHRRCGRAEAVERATALLDLVGIPDARARRHAYPHQLSGGMRQRVMIAMALSCDPKLLIADEPTTALDVTIQAQVLELLQELQRRTGMAMLFITHNLGVVAEIADRVMVMYAGRVVERATAGPLFARPLMPYTRGLLRSVPRLDRFRDRRGAALDSIPGNVPDPGHPPPGCVFHPRCGHRQTGLCDALAPVLEPAESGHEVRCLRWRDAEREAAA